MFAFLKNRSSLIKTGSSAKTKDVAHAVVVGETLRPGIAVGGEGLTNVNRAPASLQTMRMPMVGAANLPAWLGTIYPESFNYAGLSNPTVAKLRISEDIQVTEGLALSDIEFDGIYSNDDGGHTVTFLPANANSGVHGQVFHAFDLEISSDDVRKLIGKMTIDLQTWDGSAWQTMNSWVFPKVPRCDHFRFISIPIKQAVSSQRVLLDGQTLYYDATVANQKKVRYLIKRLQNDAAISVTGRLLSYRSSGTTDLLNFWGS